MLSPISLKTLACLVAAAALWGCGNSGTNETGESAGTAVLPDALILSAEPAGAKEIAKLKEEAKEGDKVVLSGIIGGRVVPFVTNRAIVTVVDAGMRNQCNLPTDDCKTPWDYCCSDSKVLLKNMATVQFVDEKGQPLHLDLTKEKRMPPASHVLVEGTVTKRTDPNALVINATGVFIKSKP